MRAVTALTVNDLPAGDTIVLRLENATWVPVDSLTSSGLQTAGGRVRTLDDRPFIALESLAPDVSFEFDEVEVVLRVKAAGRRFGARELRLSSLRPDGIERATNASGFINYAASFAEEGQTLATEAGINVGGWLLHGSLSRDPRGDLLRGPLSVTRDDERRLRRWEIGDASLSGGAFGGIIPIAGLTISRQFTIDPYFVQYTPLQLNGTAATPSTADVYVNGQLVRRVPIAPGSFTISDLPVAVGAGQAEVVVRDAFGREQRIGSTFYTPASVLRPGLHEYQYGIGLQRAPVGTRLWDYDGLTVMGEHRIGVREGLTLGGRFEAARDLAGLAPSIALRLPIGEMEAQGAVSRAGGRTGGAGLLAWSYRGRLINGSVSWRETTRSYETVGERLRQRAVLETERQVEEAFANARIVSGVEATSMSGSMSGSIASSSAALVSGATLASASATARPSAAAAAAAAAPAPGLTPTPASALTSPSASTARAVIPGAEIDLVDTRPAISALPLPTLRSDVQASIGWTATSRLTLSAQYALLRRWNASPDGCDPAAGAPASALSASLAAALCSGSMTGALIGTGVTAVPGAGAGDGTVTSIASAASAISRGVWGREERLLFGAAWQVGSRLGFSASIGRSRAGGRSRTEAFVGLNIFLRERVSASAGVNRGSSSGTTVALQRSTPIGPGYGYRLQWQSDPRNAGVDVQAQGGPGRVELRSSHLGDGGSVTASVMGALAMVGGRLYATRPIDDAFALVRVADVPGVRAFASNQFVGKTDRRGDVLVPNLVSYYGNRLSIAEEDVPLTREIGAAERVIAPSLRGGALVRFAAVSRYPVTGRFVLRDLVTVPSFGEASTRTLREVEVSPLGRRGEFYFERLEPGSRRVSLHFGDRWYECPLVIPEHRDATGRAIDLGTIICYEQPTRAEGAR